MNAYETHVAALADPIAFPLEVFAPSAERSQQLCEFMLSLALVFNDLRDIYLAQILLGEVIPKGNTPSAKNGQAGGIGEHLVRILIGVLHELLVLVDANKSILTETELLRIVGGLHPDARKAWRAITSIEKGSKSDDPLARFLYWTRNQVAFHYDQRSIMAGYRQAFADPEANVPYISSGKSMAATRFYFADAAAAAYVRDASRIQVNNFRDLLEGRAAILQQIAHALRTMVASFVARAAMSK